MTLCEKIQYGWWEEDVKKNKGLNKKGWKKFDCVNGLGLVGRVVLFEGRRKGWRFNLGLVEKGYLG